jgi:hypothetical protein
MPWRIRYAGAFPFESGIVQVLWHNPNQDSLSFVVRIGFTGEAPPKGGLA